MHSLAFAQTISGYVNRDLLTIVVLAQQISVTFRAFLEVTTTT